MRVQRIALALVLFASTLGAQTWSDLEHGNERFRGKSPLVFRGLVPLRVKLEREGQHPRVTVLSCADSRVPPELVFDQTMGRLFVVRVAGNVASAFDIASIEYAVARGYTKTLIVLGHQHCGAVQAALSGDDPGTPALRELVARIRESFTGKPPIDEAIKANARYTVEYLKKNSEVIRNAKDLEIFAAYYDMKTGKVERLE